MLASGVWCFGVCSPRHKLLLMEPHLGTGISTDNKQLSTTLPTCLATSTAQPTPRTPCHAPTMQRFRQLAGDKRAWLCVVPNPTPEEAALQNPFPTLETALAAAR